MGTAMRHCKHSGVEHVRKFVAYAKQQLNSASYYPPLNSYRHTVALALYSKCLTVAEATLVLLDAGYSDEAFGLTRTLIDIYITMHYIANQDSEERARLYFDFAAKDIQGWHELVADYFPQFAQPMSARTVQAAAKYSSPHRWSGKTAKDMALEPDMHELDPLTGKSMVHDFHYRVVYRWTSHFVHPTIAALKNHVVQPGQDKFTVRSMNEEDMSSLAVSNVATYVSITMIGFYRIMADPQPGHVGTLSGALMKHLARRHKRD